MIDPADVDFAKRCLETYYENCSQVLPGVPAEMRRGEWEQDGWTYWKLIPSRLTEADVHALESELTFHLPPLFRAFLISYFVLGLDFGEFQLPRLPCDEPLKEVRRYLLQPELWRIGYAQFGRNVEGDPVCFDLKAPAADGDYLWCALTMIGLCRTKTGSIVIELNRMPSGFQIRFASSSPNCAHKT